MITNTKHSISSLITLLIVLFAFSHCSKDPIEVFCCDIYGKYIGTQIHTSIHAGNQQYSSYSDTTDYEFTISNKGDDSISVTKYNVTTQSSSQYDLPLMEMAIDTVIFGKTYSIYHTFDSLVCIFYIKNDAIHLEQRKRHQQAPGNSLQDESYIFRGIKQ